MSSTWLRFSPFEYFERSGTCPGCLVPIVVTRDAVKNVWVLVHGEVPMACWKDETFGDWLDVDEFNIEFRRALASAHRAREG